MPVARFLRQAWQRRPFLIRAALPNFQLPVDRDRLFELARRDDVESRLVTRFNGRWRLQQGPLTRLPPLRRAGWTVLVQGVDLHDTGAHALLSRFRFIPDARLDDLMISYANQGGGVGAHVDSYDVFLLQAQGRRRWRIGRERDTTLVAGAPIRVLARFRAEHEWVLEPGDLLYLPPGVAHEGVAIGEGLTYSIGFRAPTYQELFEPWLADFAQETALTGRYADPGLRAVRRPGELPSTMVKRVHAQLVRERPRARDTQRFLLRHLSEPKPQVVFERPRRAQPQTAFLRLATRRGIALDRRTRMLYTRTGIGINGDWQAMPRRQGALFSTLADDRRLEGTVVADMGANAGALLHGWYRAGWIHLQSKSRAQ